jgi:hypothetical protein
MGNNVTDTSEEWVIYRLKNGNVNAVPRHRMEQYVKDHKATWDELVEEMLAEGLTEDEAKRYRALTKET